MSATVSATGAPIEFGEFLQRVVAWLKTNSRQAVRSALVGGAVGYAANFLLMLFVYDGHAVGAGAPVTGTGSLLTGSLVWGIGSLTVFSLIGYRRAVGSEQFWHDVRNLPSTIGVLFGQDGKAARVHVLWGAAVGLLGMQVISPWLSAVVAAALVASAPSLVGRIISNLLFRGWSALVRTLAPTRRHRAGGPVIMAVGVIGSAAALALGFFVTGRIVKLILALVCALTAWILSMTGKKSSAVSTLLLFAFGALALAAIGGPFGVITLADDGGWIEAGGSVEGWLRSQGAATLIFLSGFGSVVSALGSAAGSAVGGFLGTGQSFEPASGPVEPPTLIDPDTGEPLVTQDGRYEGGEIGQVWYDGQWVDRTTAAQWISERRQEIRSRQLEIDKFWDESQRISQEWMKQRSAENLAEEEMFRQRELDQSLRKVEEERRNERILQNLKKVIREQEDGPGKLEDYAEANELARQGNHEAILDLYRDKLREQIAASSALSASEQNWARAYGAGEGLAAFTRDAAKAGLAVTGGHLAAAAGAVAGVTASAVGTGLISGAGEGAESAQRGDDPLQVLKKTGAGFLSGAKDGAVSTFTNLPGTGMATKILLPAAADATETYVRTGDARKAALHGAISGLGAAAGQGIDRFGGEGTAGKVADALASGLEAGATNVYVSGGSFEEGFFNGIGGHLAGRAGGAAAGRAAGGASDFVPQDSGARTDEPGQSEEPSSSRRTAAPSDAAPQSKPGEGESPIGVGVLAVGGRTKAEDASSPDAPAPRPKGVDESSAPQPSRGADREGGEGGQTLREMEGYSHGEHGSVEETHRDRQVEYVPVNAEGKPAQTDADGKPVAHTPGSGAQDIAPPFKGAKVMLDKSTGKVKDIEFDQNLTPQQKANIRERIMSQFGEGSGRPETKLPRATEGPEKPTRVIDLGEGENLPAGKTMQEQMESILKGPSKADEGAASTAEPRPEVQSAKDRTASEIGQKPGDATPPAAGEPRRSEVDDAQRKMMEDKVTGHRDPHPGIPPDKDVVGYREPPPDTRPWSSEQEGPRGGVQSMIFNPPRTVSVENIDTDPGTHFYGHDEIGRPNRASAWLAPQKGTDATGQTFLKGLGLDRGHLVPNQYGGRGDITVPMTPQANVSHVRTIEQKVIPYLNEGYAVKLDVEVRYPPGGDGTMPSSIIHHVTVADPKTGEVIKTIGGEVPANSRYVWGEYKEGSRERVLPESAPRRHD